MRSWALILVSLLAILLRSGLAQPQCGRQAGGALCAGGLCCSQYGYCGSTFEYCDPATCQSQCHVTPTPGPSGGGISSLITVDMFNQILLHRNDPACPAQNFYTYDAFINAAGSFGAFGTSSDSDTNRREIAAFLAQTSHETTGGWPTAPDGPYAWGYCFLREQNPPSDYCVQSAQWPCAPGQQYYGRGPIQLTSNINYGQAGQAIGADLLNNPDLAATNQVISFETAFWFWMTPQSPKPSCHDVITGAWTPSAADQAAGRLPGYGTITNIINGGLECGHGSDPRVQDRIGFYQRYCQIFGVSPGNNLDCGNQTPYGNELLVDAM